MSETTLPLAKTRRKAVASATPSITATVQKRRLREAELLLEVSRKMSVTDSLDEVLNTLLDATTAELNAERGTLFLNDYETNELYSRVAQGSFRREIRILNTTGVAGHVFTTGQGAIVHDAYADARFNRSVDERTGYVTRNILCVPIKTAKGSCSTRKRAGLWPPISSCSGKWRRRARWRCRARR